MGFHISEPVALDEDIFIVQVFESGEEHVIDAWGSTADEATARARQFVGSPARDDIIDQVAANLWELWQHPPSDPDLFKASIYAAYHALAHGDELTQQEGR